MQKNMKINDIAQMLGVSRKTIRNYEKKGIVTPTRDSLNYRDYSTSNLFSALHCLRFNRLGLSISEISKAFDSNVDYMVDILEKIYAKERRNLKLSWLNVKFLEDYKKEITTAKENVGMYWVESLPAVQWAPLFSKDEDAELSLKNEKKPCVFMKYVQYCRCEVLIRPESDLLSSYEFETGLSISDDFLGYLDELGSSGKYRIEQRKYLVTICKVENKDDLDDGIRKLTQNAIENGLRFEAKTLIRAKLCMIEHNARYYKISFPFEKKNII